MSTTHVMHRHLHHTPPVAVGGQGVWLHDAAGRSYLDASGGAAVSCLGHGHPDVLAAMHRQIDQLAYAHTSFFTTEVAEQLAEQLVRTAPAGMSHAYFVSGGSEAVEAALKMARQYYLEIGQPERSHFIARRQSYHGNTLGALAVGGNEWRRRQFAPLLVDVTHVSPCYPYRDQRADETPETAVVTIEDGRYVMRTGEENKAFGGLMKEIGPDLFAVMVREKDETQGNLYALMERNGTSWRRWGMICPDFVSLAEREGVKLAEFGMFVRNSDCVVDDFANLTKALRFAHERQKPDAEYVAE